MPTGSWTVFPKAGGVSVLLVGLVLGSIWVTEVAHWYVEPRLPNLTEVNSARKLPQKDLVEELAAMPLGAVAIAPAHVVLVAEQLKCATLNLPAFSHIAQTLLFSQDDLVNELSTYTVAVASLRSTNILLDAISVTWRKKFLQKSSQIIASLARHQAAQRFDHGPMRNDHATAAHTPALIKFLAHYRIYSSFYAALDQTVLKLVSRSEKLLIKPFFCAWRAGHGIVCNVAFLRMTVAFTESPEVSTTRRNAIGRFIRQLMS